MSFGVSPVNYSDSDSLNRDYLKNLFYGTRPSFRGGSSFRGIRVFQLKLYFHTKCHVDWRLPSTLCKKNNKVCFYEGCSIFSLI